MTTKAPNIVIILLDDLGFANFGCYGSAIETPTIDAVGEEGLRYNNFHVTAACSPTRACVITGRNHHSVGMGLFPELSQTFPGYTGRIPATAGTLPRSLHDAGYNTFAVGKWHLTPAFDRTAAGPFDHWPLGLGFERYYGFHGGMTNQWTPDLVRDNGLIEPPSTPEQGYHLTEDLATQAIRLIQDQQQAAADKPFFLYFAPGATHSWHQVPDIWTEPYRGAFDAGWEAVRDQAFEKQLELEIVPSGTVLTERPPWVAAWDQLPREARHVFARQMEVYAGFLAHTDAQIARLLDFIDLSGNDSDTIVMILSDNGASPDGGPNGFLSPAISDVASMADKIDEFGGHSSLNHFAWGWAWAGNTPFRLWKYYSWLGGVRVPLIVRWPARIAANERGGVRSQFCHAVDLMPTLLAAAGADAPSLLDGIEQQPIDGASILETFDAADAPSPRRTQYFETMGSRAIYHDGWKATTDHVVAIGSGGAADYSPVLGSTDFETDRWSLFHLDEDFSEGKDRAEDHPELLREMIDLWSQEANRNNVLPFRDTFSDDPETFQSPPYSESSRNVYLPGGGPIITRTYFDGFHLVADVEIAKGADASGVIVSHRNYLIGWTEPGGWACYILDGHLCFAFDLDGSSPQVFSRAFRLSGCHRIEVELRFESEDEGSIIVAVDGRIFADRPVAAPQMGMHLPFFAGKLLIGRDEPFPLGDGYQAPFPFSQKIHRVTYDPAAARPSAEQRTVRFLAEHD